MFSLSQLPGDRPAASAAHAQGHEYRRIISSHGRDPKKIHLAGVKARDRFRRQDVPGSTTVDDGPGFLYLSEGLSLWYRSNKKELSTTVI